MLCERTGWSLDYVMQMPLPQLRGFLEHLAKIDRVRGE